MNISTKFKYGLILNTLFAVFEFTIGIVFGSLALISDAVHNLSDAFSMLVAWIADRLSKSTADNVNTYGLKRAKIIGALINSIVLLVISLFIFYEAYNKFISPQETPGGIVAIIATVGIFVNGFIAFIFRGSKNDLNQKAAFINMAMDVFASVMTLIGGVLITFTGSKLIDPLISLLIGVILLYNCWEILKEVIEILLETTPKNINVQIVSDEILKNSCILEVIDLHIWSLSSDYLVLTTVLNTKKECLENIDLLVQEIKSHLQKNFDINHITIEIRLKATRHLE